MDNLEGKRVSCKIALLFALRLYYGVGHLSQHIAFKILQRVLSTSSGKNLKEIFANVV
jgi:hypothetical protein